MFNKGDSTRSNEDSKNYNPIFKGSNPEEVGNYRPVSLLQMCSKYLRN